MLRQRRRYSTSEGPENGIDPFLGQPQSVMSGILPQEDEIIRVDPETVRRADRDRNIDVIVYQCQWDLRGTQCQMWVEGDVGEVLTHLRQYHGVEGRTKDAIICSWRECAQEFKLGSMPRHVMTHLGVRFQCSNCKGDVAREDYLRAHFRKVEACSGANAVIVPGPDARIVGRECSVLL
ncbi:hypothetical protein HYDPIDRAFT_109964 [Hydnomerulius pinastri MD-312]|nr:hypothetical protein HYDPIDRAFT_109964 [Hydnomerulius pinastri MD-312]